MKRFLLLLGCSMLASVMAFAQDAPAGSASATQDQSTQTQTRTTQTSVIRGCLTGSSGNYTVTDANGMQYGVNGDDNTLRSMAGREVEMTVSEDRSSEASGEAGATTAHSSNTVQVSDIKAVASSCHKVGSTGPSSNTTPNAAPDERPGPQMMAMLQQQSAPTHESQSPNGSAPQVQSTPPVTSQTPATSASPTSNAGSPVGTSPSNSSGMTGSEVNQNAQAARRGEMNTNPQTGTTTGGGLNNPAVTSSNPPPSSPNSATPSANTQPQGPCNKPLYECPATNIPWANSSAGNNSTPPPQH